MATFCHQKIKFLAIFILSIYYVNTNAQLLYQDCYEDFGEYDILSDYGANVDKAIEQLVELASTSYFNKISVGKGGDKVNALFSCRYDMTSDDCQSCLQSSLENVPHCYRSVESAQFYQECTLRYSNATIFSVLEYLPRYSIHSLDAVNDDGEFIQLLSETISDLITETVSEFSVSSRYFATTTADYSVLKTLYALAQCNEDLSSSDCEQCLQIEFGNFTSNYPGAFLGQIFTPSCRLSYKLSSVTMTTPYDFDIPIVTTPDEELTSPPMSSPADDSLTAPPPSDESSMDEETMPPPPPYSSLDDESTMPPPFGSPDEELAPPPPPYKFKKGFSAMKSSGTREVTSYLIALLCVGLFLSNL
ncbi:hypothetical protein RND81_10G022300 [Saponaria officinalis]|uniref:Gnk2-homologous domain-containing protein n=1 Tax=Saponaria officinalis TaxID=3572 RepID=A0AAW1HXZ8_SAPOF